MSFNSSYSVAGAEELSDGERLLVTVDGREIVLFQQQDEYYAYANWCPHQGGPCGNGDLTGTIADAQFDRDELTTTVTWGRDGEILNCPWHGWEFDVQTGESLSRAGAKLREYDVTVEDGEIIVHC